MHPKAMSKTNKYRSRGLPYVGGTKTGGERRYSLIFSKAHWQSSFQTVGWFFLRRRKIGSHMSVSLIMKWLIYCSLPRKPLISLSPQGRHVKYGSDLFKINLFTPLTNNVPTISQKLPQRCISWGSTSA